MPVDSTYSDGKLALGCVALAQHRGRIKERLAYAAGEFAGVSTAAFRDPSLAARWVAVWTRLTSVSPIGNEGRIGASLDAMTEDEACELASEIVGIWQEQDSTDKSE